MATPAKLESEHGALLVEFAGQQRKVTLEKASSTVGRSDECDVVIPDFRVSRLHARIYKESGNFFVEDAGSRHGTFVNGTRCERSPLHNKDVITLGVPGLSLTLLTEAPASSTRNLLLTRIGSPQGESSELEQLRLFLEAARTLASGGIVDDVLKRMLSVALRLTRAERGFVYLADKQGRPQMACGVDAAGNELLRDSGVSHSVVEEALRSAEFITGDATRQSELAGRESILLNELRTLVAIPLRAHRMRLEPQGPSAVNGVLYLDSRSVSGSLHGISHDVLRALAGECAAVLESARLVETEQEQLQYRQEMAIAASIQRSLTSQHEVMSDIAWARGHSTPCKEIGGDFFDIHVTPEALTAIVVDVSGKGISAALLASVIHGMFYAQISSGTALVDAASVVNNFLCSRVGGQKYATLLAAQVRRDNTLHLVNCGHVPALVLKDGSVLQVEDGDLPVGLLPDAGFHTVELPFPPGSRLCILTDGISEAENLEHEEFGLQRVKQHLLSPDPAKAIVADLEAFCGNLEPQDDQTLVLVERLA
ncbi:MAG TPA: SpoIIE family protein phosphatase [Candidatus Angelobacter sp.]